MLHAGLDLSRRRLDVCLLDERGELLAEARVTPDADTAWAAWPAGSPGCRCGG
jgi:hypothetical protein